MDIDIETLDLNDFNIEDYNNDEDIFNIIYSYPFYSDENYDYEFRFTIKDDNITLDELITNDDRDDFDNCIVETKHILTKNIKEIITLIKENKDIRNGNDLIVNDYIELNINEENKEAIIEENKKNVLKDLYTELLSYYE